MTKERILIVEDEAAVARGLEYGLSREGFDVLCASTGKQALAMVKRSTPHLILLDIRLPDISGFDVCRRLRAKGHRQPIVMLTARDEEIDKILGLELGADDYVVKPFSLREVISRIRAMLRRAYGDLAAPFTHEKLYFGSFVMDVKRFHLSKAGKSIELTPTEFRLLHHLAAHPKRPFSRSELIEAVWGYDSEIYNERTVDVHIRHLRAKIEPEPAQPRWIVTMRGVGYMFAP